MINAKMILHSINPHGGELISIQGYAPYFLDAELEKHGMIMSNSSSNRAIPFKKMVQAEPFIPPDIRKEAKGMQGFEKLNSDDYNLVHGNLIYIRELVIENLLNLQDQFKIHKQTLNRYISPWSMQTKIMTGTRESWEGVLKLRDHEDAEPSVQVWATHIKNTIENSEPQQLQYGQWHLPYLTEDEYADYKEHDTLKELEYLIISSARCARTSYRLFDGKNASYELDNELFIKLVGSDPVHATPLEHQGLCVEQESLYDPTNWIRGQTHMMRDGSIGSGRMIGWIQNRHWWDYES